MLQQVYRHDPASALDLRLAGCLSLAGRTCSAQLLQASKLRIYCVAALAAVSLPLSISADKLAQLALSPLCCRVQPTTHSKSRLRSSRLSASSHAAMASQQHRCQAATWSPALSPAQASQLVLTDLVCTAQHWSPAVLQGHCWAACSSSSSRLSRHQDTRQADTQRSPAALSPSRSCGVSLQAHSRQA